MFDAESRCDRLCDELICRGNNNAQIAGVAVTVHESNSLRQHDRRDPGRDKLLPECVQLSGCKAEYRLKREGHIAVNIKLTLQVLLIERVILRPVSRLVDKPLLDKKLSPGMIAVASK